MSFSTTYTKKQPTRRKIPDSDKQAQHALQGKINRAAGRAFEERIDLTFEFLKKKGKAMIDKTPEPTKIIQKLEGGRFVGVYTKKGQPDYKGILPGGKTVIFEAKFTSTDRLQQSAVTEGQFDYLTKASELGALCYIIGGFRSGNVYKIPWRVWCTMKDRFGRKYVTEDDLEEYIVSNTRAGLLVLVE